VSLPPVLDGAGHVLDRIQLTGLTVFGHHGVLEHERRDGQDFVVDVVLHLDTRAAAETDDLARTVHYGQLAEELAAVISGEPVDLLETLAERLASQTLRHERVRVVDVSVHKPSAPVPVAFEDVAVSVRRARETLARETPARGCGDVGVRAVLALGANLGDRRATLQSAVEALAAIGGVVVTAVSPIVETHPVGGPAQPDYLNAVVLVDTTLSPHELLSACQRIELDHGRVRAVRWEARTLDIDIVAYGDVVTTEDILQLPHPRAAQRAFVLAPWAAVDPDAALPGPDSSPTLVHELLARAADAAAVRPAEVAPLEMPA
jgi:dihydroneopterin aldolase/2-amino-4-hydroxy-6-hydroxymethyldihydropteridine diphosphokinase